MTGHQHTCGSASTQGKWRLGREWENEEPGRAPLTCDMDWRRRDHKSVNSRIEGSKATDAANRVAHWVRKGGEVGTIAGCVRKSILRGKR